MNSKAQAILKNILKGLAVLVTPGSLIALLLIAIVYFYYRYKKKKEASLGPPPVANSKGIVDPKSNTGKPGTNSTV